MPAWETDPEGRTTFCEIDTEGYIIECLADVPAFFKALEQIGTQLSLQEGYVIYPYVRLDYGPGNA